LFAYRELPAAKVLYPAAPIGIGCRRRPHVLFQEGQRWLGGGYQRPDRRVRATGIGVAEVAPERFQRFVAQNLGPRLRRRTQIPKKGRGVRTGGQDATAIGAEGAPGYLAAVPTEGAPQLSRSHFPQLQALLFDSAAFIDRECQEPAVGRQDEHAADDVRACRSLEIVILAALCQVSYSHPSLRRPEPRPADSRSGRGRPAGDPFAVGEEREIGQVV